MRSMEARLDSDHLAWERWCSHLSNRMASQGCPNLNAQGVLAGTHERLQLEILLKRLEKQLDLPTVFVDGGNGGGAKLQQVGKQHDLALPHAVPPPPPPQQAGAIL